MANLPFLPQLCEFTDRVLKWNPGVGAMELIDVNAIEAQTPQASLQGLTKMFGASVLWPLVGASTQKTPLSRDDQAFRIGVERFGNERLGYLWSVGISGIEQVHSQFKGVAQDGDSFLLVSRWSPDARACEAHSAEAETIHRQVSANRKCSAVCSGSLGCVLHTPISSMNWIMREKSASLPFAMAAVDICWLPGIAYMP